MQTCTCTCTHTHTFLVMFAGKTIDYLDNCDKDAYAHSSHQCVPLPTKCYDATGTNFEARVYPARNRLAQACVLLFYRPFSSLGYFRKSCESTWQTCIVWHWRMLDYGAVTWHMKRASAQLTSAAWVPGTGQTRIYKYINRFDIFGIEPDQVWFLHQKFQSH